MLTAKKRHPSQSMAPETTHGTLPRPSQEQYSIQLGEEVDSDRDSQLRRKLLEGYTTPSIESRERRPPAPLDGSFSHYSDQTFSQNHTGPGPALEQHPTSYQGNGLSPDAGESLRLGVGLKNYVPPARPGDAFPSPHVWQRTSPNLPHADPDRPSDRTEVWQSAVQDYLLLQPTPQPVDGPDEIPSDLLGSPVTTPPLISLSPEHRASSPAVGETNLLHLGIPWFSGDVGEEEGEMGFDEHHPPLSTQLEGRWAVKDEMDEFSAPMDVDVRVREMGTQLIDS